jgi:transcriptional regulator with XRE-family HTH domain
MSTNLECYLKPYRRRWGLKQDELGRLLGVRTGTIVSRLERGVRDPSLADAYAFEIILGTNPIELFPGFYDELQGNASRDTELKLDLFEDIFARQEKRSDARYE